MVIDNIAWNIGNAFGMLLPFIIIGLVVWGIVALVRKNKSK